MGAIKSLTGMKWKRRTNLRSASVIASGAMLFLMVVVGLQMWAPRRRKSAMLTSTTAVHSDTSIEIRLRELEDKISGLQRR